MKKVIEGYLCYSSIFGVSLHPKVKKWVSASDDIFTGQMKDFEGKKVRITVETLS